MLLVGATGFLAFSIACSVAPTISSIIVARALQGAFGGVLIPLSFQLIVTELPPSKHPLGMALFAVANNVAQAAGPSLGGWLTDMYSWRWIFYLQIPPAIALIAAIAWAIRPVPVQLSKLRQADWFGIATMALGLSALQIVLEEGGRKDWFASDLIVELSIVAAAGRRVRRDRAAAQGAVHQPAAARPLQLRDREPDAVPVRRGGVRRRVSCRTTSPSCTATARATSASR